MRAETGVARYHVPNLLRALDLLELLGRRPRGLTKAELIERLGISSNSAYRIASSLAARGYLERDEKTKRFRLTGKLLDLGCAARDENSLVEASWDLMKALRDETGESIFVGQRHGDGGIVLEQAMGRHNITINVDKGTRFDLHAPAPGKCLLAFSPPDECEALLRRIDLKPLTRRTITTRAGLRREVERIRERGYSTDLAETMDGIHCVAVPLYRRDRSAAGTLWTVCPAERFPREQFPQRSLLLKRTAARISERLGYRP